MRRHQPTVVLSSPISSNSSDVNKTNWHKNYLQIVNIQLSNLSTCTFSPPHHPVEEHIVFIRLMNNSPESMSKFSEQINGGNTPLHNGTHWGTYNNNPSG